MNGVEAVRKETNKHIGRLIGYQGLQNFPSWEGVVPWVDHPNGQVSGSLVRNRETGVYMLFVQGVFTAVPQGWAESQKA